jgi:signal transduction histidine kinase
MVADVNLAAVRPDRLSSDGQAEAQPCPIASAPYAKRALGAGTRRLERVAVWEFLDEMAVVPHVHQSIHFSVEPVERHLAVDADLQLLTSAVMNLLNNALKYSDRCC